MKKPERRADRDSAAATPEAGLLAAGVLSLAAVLMAGSFVRPPSEATFSVGLAGDGEYILREASAKSDQADSAISGWRGLLLGNPLDPGSATAEDLMALPGVGEKTALKILATREKLGGFSDSGDIRKTPGIGKVRYGKLKEWLTVSKYKDAEGEK